MSGKDRVINIVNNALAGAEDNLYRANLQFKNYSDLKMADEYGFSGRTCDEVLSGYKKERRELLAAKKWIEGVKP